MRYRVTITDNNIGVHHVPSWRKQSGCLPAAEIAMAKDGLRGRTALVTGGSRGIGAAISRALAEAGAGLAINYRERSDHAKNLADELLNTGVRAITVQADVSQPDAVAKMVEVVKSELGTIDILVNNAGIAITRGINDLSEADFDRTIAVNLKSVFLCTQAVLPMMQAKQWGRIINISSGAARGAGAIGPHYNASKAAVEGLTRGYAARLVKDGITINAVAPSLIETDMMKGQENLVSRIPLGRFGTADEVAKAVMMLVDNPYMTGQTVAMSGGMSFS
jgi:3-oxoacyl-[acyl-carrier protein] reductase